MKKYFALMLFLTTFAAHACPTCIGRITKKSPPFFSNESSHSNTARTSRNKAVNKKETAQHKTTTEKKEAS